MAAVLSGIYNSGLGWINDILTLHVFYDADLEAYSSIPHLVKDANSGESRVEHHRPVFAGGAQVRGFVRATAPPDRTIAHTGVSVRLESGLFALDDLNTRDLYNEERIIAPAGSVSGVMDFPFSFPGTGRYPLAESFEGALFSIRHQVAVTVGRPWYTFAVSSSSPFAVQRIHDIHKPYVEKDVEGAAGAPTDASAIYKTQALELDKFEDGGSCIFQYEKGWCVSLAGDVRLSHTGCAPQLKLNRFY